MLVSSTMELCARLKHRIDTNQEGADDVVYPTWEDVEVPSASEPGKVYVVAYSPYGASQSVCDCEGFRFRGFCRHIEQARSKVNCDWMTTNAEVQDNGRICPKCGGPTVQVRSRR